MPERRFVARVRLTEDEAHPSRATMPRLVLSEDAAAVLMPRPPHGWLRRTCENVWWATLVPFALAAVMVWRFATWQGFAVACVFGGLVSFTHAVASDRHTHYTDRQAFAFGAFWAVFTMALLAVLGGLVWRVAA